MASEIILNPVLVNKIQNYLNDPVYRETIENAAQYNSRLGAERTMRLPFLDSQTGVAQNHSNLFMDQRQRLPGLKEGQIYSYPSKRWRKKRRQYLNNFMQPRLHLRKDPVEEEPIPLAIEASPYPTGPVPSTSGGTLSSAIPEEIKETIPKDEPVKPEWFYDELDVPDAGEFDEPDADSDYDYEESYSSKRKKGKAKPKTPRQVNKNRRKITYDPITDSEKPFACDLCGARYKTRPGLTYHYTHSHKEKEDEEEDDSNVPASPKRDEARRSRGGMPPPVLHPQQPMGGLQPPTLQPQQPIPSSHLMPIGNSPVGGNMMPPPQMMHHGHNQPPPHLIPQQQPHLMSHQPPHGYHHPPPPGGPPSGPYMQQHQQMTPQQQQHLQQQQSRPASNTPSDASNSGPSPINSEDQNLPKRPDDGKPRVQASPYCDFCLGDAVENKKSGSPEELVSCSDCGRSGHPTCLQFTANMIISVKKYRWQCIECKCCSICGTSDNDDQLLFCDDCDRGYHMYCLSPPLDAPPEGSWSCTLCITEFHKR